MHSLNHFCSVSTNYISIRRKFNRYQKDYYCGRSSHQWYQVDMRHVSCLKVVLQYIFWKSYFVSTVHLLLIRTSYDDLLVAVTDVWNHCSYRRGPSKYRSFVKNKWQVISSDEVLIFIKSALCSYLNHSSPFSQICCSCWCSFKIYRSIKRQPMSIGTDTIVGDFNNLTMNQVKWIWGLTMLTKQLIFRHVLWGTVGVFMWH